MPDWSWSLYPYVHLLGRILFSAIFLRSGVGHLRQLNAMAGYAASKGVPAPKFMTALTGVMLLVGSLTILAGWHRFIGAGLLAIFLLPTAFMMHAFWKEQDPGARMNEMVAFYKDLSLAGAALLIAYYSGGPWPLSLGN